ncbi:chorismate lyase [Uliginosibacterium sp. sgz301328]|uniref:chorismate--pyruvate lyase family protein n=1 Tax=Uliginosibacterium sp. sgz301328 TaxID=3243764 RepID=UPI00359D631D
MSLRIPLHGRRDCWRAPPPPRPDPVHPWLTDPGSLTARIAARCERVSVRVLAQHMDIPNADEAALLGTRRGERVWLREVLLLADGRPVVHARSLMPRERGWRLFGTIGSRPLGHALFADPHVSRGRLTARRLDARDRRYHRAIAVAESTQGATLWARRSLFTRQSGRLLVCEVFLASILDLPT